MESDKLQMQDKVVASEASGLPNVESDKIQMQHKVYVHQKLMGLTMGRVIKYRCNINYVH